MNTQATKDQTIINKHQCTQSIHTHKLIYRNITTAAWDRSYCQIMIKNTHVAIWDVNPLDIAIAFPFFSYESNAIRYGEIIFPQSDF